MTDKHHQNSTPTGGQEEAAAWMWRLDRGLTAREQDAFFDWLAADPANATLLEKQKQNWKRLDQLAAWRPEHGQGPNPDLLAPPNPSWFKRYFVQTAVAAAAAIAIAIFGFQHLDGDKTPHAEVATLKQENREVLEDGSTIKLNDNAKLSVLYNKQERRVRLDSGEAFFIVEKDPQRPFVVEVEGTDVQAVGTAFNVRIGRDSLEVLVAEGVVEVAPYNSETNSSLETATKSLKPLLEAKQRAIIPLLGDVLASPQIDTLSKGEIQRVLAWQHGLMTFDAKPLGEIVEELNHLNDIQLKIIDPALSSTRFSGTISSRNLDGFVRLLEAGFGAQSETNGQTRILSKAD